MVLVKNERQLVTLRSELERVGLIHDGALRIANELELDLEDELVEPGAAILAQSDGRLYCSAGGWLLYRWSMWRPLQTMPGHYRTTTSFGVILSRESKLDQVLSLAILD